MRVPICSWEKQEAAERRLRGLAKNLIALQSTAFKKPSRKNAIKTTTKTMGPNAYKLPLPTRLLLTKKTKGDSKINYKALTKPKSKTKSRSVTKKGRFTIYESSS